MILLKKFLIFFINFSHFFLKLLNEEESHLPRTEFLAKCLAFGAKVDNILYEQIADEWLDGKSVAIKDLALYYLYRYPTEPPPPRKNKKPSRQNKNRKKKLN